MELEQMLRSHLFSSYDPNIKPNAEMPDSQIKVLLDVMLEQVLDLTIKQESLESFRSILGILINGPVNACEKKPLKRVRMTIHHEWNDPRKGFEMIPSMISIISY